ncbi:globin [Gorillibacterium massiliense]|uniref:globin domain-containing protein n=1 Tax=Gorillibacterium massiliense TaxID=1280390 RepID=UPI0004AE9243|nr:globin [Gorillibacterium massiliense]
MVNLTLYEAMGGEAGIRRLVEVFYPIVVADPDLGPHFPADIRPVQEKQFMFLTQFFGGPALYTEEYGHPMMRARHMHIPLTLKLSQAWLRCMSQALAETGMDPELSRIVMERLSAPAHHFINTPE